MAKGLVCMVHVKQMYHDLHHQRHGMVTGPPDGVAVVLDKHHQHIQHGQHGLAREMLFLLNAVRIRISHLF